MLKLFSLLLIGVGIFILVQIAMPVLAYQAWEVEALDKNTILVDPITTSVPEGIMVQKIGNFPAFISSLQKTSPYSSFTLSIPRLKINNLEVSVNSNDFDLNPAQLPGTALPGERGNVFVTGHSSLPQVAKSSNPKVVFSKLPNVKKGDEISIVAGGVKYEYEVIGIKIVEPSEVSVINPPDSTGRYLSIMTCVPPGFNSKRLVVLSKLKS